MKPKYLTLLIILCFTAHLSAQNYQAVNSGRTQFYRSYSQDIQSLRIDSTDFSGDSILYPFTIILDTAEFCFTPSYASWIGAKVIIEPRGRTVFFNREGDSISIMHGAKTGDSWTMYMYPDSSYIQASVISHDTISFLGMNDSVKVISMQYMDKRSEAIDDKLNSMEIRISKNYGFLSTMDFFFFPNLSQDFPWWEIEVLELVGMTAPTTGIQNLTWFEVWDFEVGDELHVLDESWANDFDGYFYESTGKENHRFLKRRNYGDSIVYQVGRKKSWERDGNNGSSEKYYDDTIRISIKQDKRFDKLPGEPVFQSGDHTYNYYMSAGPPISKYYLDEGFSVGYEDCWTPLIFDGCLAKYDFYKGLGGPYYYCSNGLIFGSSERKIVYYKKGETTWGTPQIVPTSIELPGTISEIQLLPNPASDYIVIKSTHISTNKTFAILSLDGRMIKQGMIRSDMEKISLQGLDAGMYIVKLEKFAEILVVR